jgi:beta-carotene 3-hydroxylase
MFEKNDWFVVLFAIPSILCIYSGYHNDTVLLWVGVGIACYCPAYFIFHDIIVHRRIKIKYKFSSRYMKRMIRAHQLHHSTSEKDDALSFGFLYVPKGLKLGI